MPVGGLRASLGTISITMSVVDRATKRLASIAEESGKLTTRLNQGVNAARKFGVGLTAVTSMFAQMVGEAISDYKMLEAPLARLQGVTLGINKSFLEWGELAKNVAADTYTEMNKVADAFYYVASAGVQEEQQILAISTEAAKMAKIHRVDIANAVEVATVTTRAFGYALEEADKVMDIMNVAVGNAQLTFSQMSATLKYAAPVAGATSWEFNNLAAAIMTAANAGVQGSKAGTALRTMATRLAGPTSAAKALMEELNLEFFELDDAALATRAALAISAQNMEEYGNQVARTEERIESLRAEMEGWATREKEMSLMVRTIRLRADKEDRELTQNEIDRIDTLQEHIETLAINRERVSMQEAELARDRDETNRSIEAETERTAELEEQFALQRGEMKELPVIMTDLKKAFAGLSDQQQMAAMTTLFGVRALTFISSQLNAIDLDLGMTREAFNALSIAEQEQVLAGAQVSGQLIENTALLANQNAVAEQADEMFRRVAAASRVTNAEFAIHNAMLYETIAGGEASIQGMVNQVEVMGELQKSMRKVAMWFMKTIGSNKTLLMLFFMLGPAITGITTAFLMFAGAVRLLGLGPVIHNMGALMATIIKLGAAMVGTAIVSIGKLIIAFAQLGAAAMVTAGKAIASAIAFIFAAHGPIPFAGIPIALGLIGTMLAFWKPWEHAEKGGIVGQGGLVELHEGEMVRPAGWEDRTGGTTIGDINITVHTGPVSGIDDVRRLGDELGDTISKKIMREVNRSQRY